MILLKDIVDGMQVLHNGKVRTVTGFAFGQQDGKKVQELILDYGKEIVQGYGRGRFDVELINEITG